MPVPPPIPAVMNAILVPSLSIALMSSLTATYGTLQKAVALLEDMACGGYTPEKQQAVQHIAYVMMCYTCLLYTSTGKPCRPGCPAFSSWQPSFWASSTASRCTFGTCAASIHPKTSASASYRLLENSRSNHG